MPLLETLCSRIDDIENIIKINYEELLLSLKQLPAWHSLAAGEFKQGPDEKIAFQTLKNKKKLAWELAQNNCKLYVEKVKEYKPLQIALKDGSSLEFIDLREKDDYQFFVHDTWVEHSLEKLLSDGLETYNSFIQDGHFSASLVDKNAQTYRSTQPAYAALWTMGLILSLSPHSMLRAFPGDAYSPVTTTNVADKAKVAKYLQVVRQATETQNLREFAFRSQENLNHLDAQSIHHLLAKAGISSEMGEVFKSSDGIDEKFIASFPDLGPTGVLNKLYLSPYGYNELIVKGNENNKIIGIMFSEHVFNAMKSDGELDDNYTRYLQFLRATGLPLLLVRQNPDGKKYTSPLACEIKKLKKDIVQLYKEINSTLKWDSENNTNSEAASQEINRQYKKDFEALEIKLIILERALRPQKKQERKEWRVKTNGGRMENGDGFELTALSLFASPKHYQETPPALQVFSCMNKSLRR